jgi:hypothetical protein
MGYKTCVKQLTLPLGCCGDLPVLQGLVLSGLERLNLCKRRRLAEKH